MLVSPAERTSSGDPGTRTPAAVGESMDALQFVVDRLGQLERIEPLEQRLQGIDAAGVGELGSDQTLERSLSAIVNSP